MRHPRDARASAAQRADHRQATGGLRRLVLGVVAVAAVCAYWPAAAAAGPFDGRGMWIWYVSASAGGNYQSIASQASANGIRTLFIKSGDGTTYWSQFTPALVSALHAYGISACAWQFVYGDDPIGEAAVGAEAVRNGADCLVIDAEAAYEGKYTSARTFIDALRSDVGTDYPLGLTSFPYVDYHPDFPYSVFLGPGGANYNLPQMYWRDIGTSVGQVYAHTYADNVIYRRPIRPLGQVDCCASAPQAQLFRGLSVAYGAGGLSWWDYAWSTARGMWPAVSGLYTPASASTPARPVLGDGDTGDMVLWMQELLRSAIPGQELDGTFGQSTAANLRLFQQRNGIPATGETGPLTWHALLQLPASTG
jgi:peptidoglycan hydrolase-like protein with peptidoglycan-binding domain